MQSVPMHWGVMGNGVAETVAKLWDEMPSRAHGHSS